MKLRYKNIRHLSFLLIFLGIPFLLRIIDYRFEIYPSVVLPAGAKTLYTGEDVRISVNEIYGRTANGKIKNLNNAFFLRPIREEYLSYFYKAHFGLTPSKNLQFNTNKLGIPISLTPKISLEDIELTKVWLRERLREQNCLDSILILKKRTMIVRNNGAFYEDNTILNDTILELY